MRLYHAELVAELGGQQADVTAELENSRQALSHFEVIEAEADRIQETADEFLENLKTATDKDWRIFLLKLDIRVIIREYQDKELVTTIWPEHKVVEETIDGNRVEIYPTVSLDPPIKNYEPGEVGAAFVYRPSWLMQQKNTLIWRIDHRDLTTEFVEA